MLQGSALVIPHLVNAFLYFSDLTLKSLRAGQCSRRSNTPKGIAPFRNLLVRCDLEMLRSIL